MFENIYGLSCVENQILAILKERNTNISPLYHNSAIPLKELFFFLVMKGEKPYSFYRIPRIQEELKAFGLIDAQLKRPKSTRSLREKLRRLKENEYILLRVKPEFTKTVLHARGFRADHFVRAKPYGNGFIIQNDIPETTVTLTAAELGKIYDSEYLLITVKKEMDAADITALWKNRLFKAERHFPFFFKEPDLEGLPDLAARLTNMIGVYKIMRCRLAEYYGAYVDTEFIRETIPTIQRYYLKAEYCNIRKNVSVQKLFEILYSFNCREVEIMNILKEKLEEKQKWKN